jgi:hypothetical protein
MIKKKFIIISFIVISLIILIIVLNISKDKNKDKYKKDDRQLIHTNCCGKHSQLKYRKKENADFFTDFKCSFTINPEDVYKIKKGKLGAVSEIDKIWKPVTDSKGIRTFDPLFIYFMVPSSTPTSGKFDPVPRTYLEAGKRGKTKLEMLDDGKYYLLFKCQNINNQWNVPDGYTVLDPLDKIFIDDPEFNIIKAVKKIIVERIQPFVNIPLIFTDQIENSHIRISFDKYGGSYSGLGTEVLKLSKKEHTMNYAYFDVGTIIHEFGHALGFIHEHQSPMEGGIQNDDWNMPELIKDMEDHLELMGIDPYDPADKKERDQFFTTNIFSDITTKQVATGSPFDEYSIMLYQYPGKVFKKISKFYKNGTRTNCIPSILDLKMLNMTYPLFDKDNKPVYIDQGVLYEMYISDGSNNTIAMYPFADDV